MRSALSSGAPEPAVTTLVVSGKTPERVASMAGDAGRLDGRCGRRCARWPMWRTRSIITAARQPSSPPCAPRDRAQAVAGLRALAAGQPRRRRGGPARRTVRARHGIRLLGSGFAVGRAWAGNCWPTSRRSPRRSPSWSRYFVEQVGFSLHDVIAGGEPVSGIARVQPVLMGMQLALTELWRSYGVQPDAVIGHSMGEVTAAVVAGALTAAEGLRVIATRSRLMSRLSGQGAVALLELDAEATAGVDRRLPGGERGGVRLAAADGDRRARRSGRRRHRRGDARRTVRPAGRTWRWPRTPR